MVLPLTLLIEVDRRVYLWRKCEDNLCKHILISQICINIYTFIAKKSLFTCFGIWFIIWLLWNLWTFYRFQLKYLHGILKWIPNPLGSYQVVVGHKMPYEIFCLNVVITFYSGFTKIFGKSISVNLRPVQTAQSV